LNKKTTKSIDYTIKWGQFWLENKEICSIK